MARKTPLPLLVAALFLAAEPAAAEGQVAVTWERAHVALPAALAGGRPVLGLWRDPAVQAAAWRLPAAGRAPAVVLLHGCNGIGKEEEILKLVLTERGFAVFLPNSFARPGRRPNCDVASYAVSLAPQAHGFRLEEIKHALARIGALPSIDPDRVFLMGFSEGGMAAAAYEGGRVAGVVIAGWHCQGRGPYRGIRAPRPVPVLAIIGEADPWYQAKPGKHCGQVFDGRPNARSLVLPGNGHAIVNSPIVENAQAATEALLGFLGAP